MKSFEQYTNSINISESEVVMLAEDLDWYMENGFIEDASVPDKETLFKLIEKNIQKAWDEFCSKKKIEYKGKMFMEAGHRGQIITLDGEKVTGKDLGVFEHGVEFAQLSLFSGRQVRYSGSPGIGAEIEGKFLFDPRIWATLSISYSSLDGGTNGLNYILETTPYKSNDVNYSILEGKWFTKNEWFAKHKPKK